MDDTNYSGSPAGRFHAQLFYPGDPVATLLGSNYTPEAYAAKAHELGLDKPFIVQYFDYVWGIITRFDFGTSYIYGHAVGPEMAARFPITLKLGVFGLALAVALGIPFGLLSATRQYSILDNSVTVFAMFFAAMPNFWLGLMLILIFWSLFGLVPDLGHYPLAELDSADDHAGYECRRAHHEDDAVEHA